MGIDVIEYSVIKLRKPGDKRITKPKELSGVKPVISIDHSQGRSKVQVFVKDDDAYLKYNDYFSPSMRESGLVGAPMEFRYKRWTGKDRMPKFIYGDAWGDVVARQEAWVKISNIRKALALGHNQAIESLVKAECAFHGWDWIDMLVSESALLFDRMIIELRSILGVERNFRYLSNP